ncbi:MAG: hypothetical protein FWD87_07485 [Spirochaetaceae bacterium]|nr:hypothetical protein [Spirochaetaceae bacterium]
MYLKYFSIILISSLIFSCTGPFNSNELDEDVTVFTIRNGSILEAGANLPVTLVYDEFEFGFDYLRIVLFDDEGKEIAVNQIARSQVGSNRRREILLPNNLEKGIYHVRFELFRNNRIVFSNITNFFYEDSSFRLNNTQSYPPNPAPGERVLFITDFTAPIGSDPYFRWIIGRNIVSEGFFSEGGNRFSWTTPSIEGAYSVSVELFPFKPLDKVFQRFNSAISSSSSVIVSESNRMRLGEFLPKESYSTLFHFRGEIYDSGYLAAGNDNLKVIGDPLPDFRGGVFGYHFNKNEFIEISNIVIPFSNEGVLQPFSIKLKFINDYSVSPDHSQNSPFFSVFSEDESFRISLWQDSRVQYFSEIVSGANRFRSNALRNRDTLNSTLNLTVSFYPGRNSCTIVWMMNGETVARETIPFLPTLAVNQGKTTIGSGLFPMLFDEAGVFSRISSVGNSVAPFCFRDYNLDILGRSFIFAEGFDYLETLSPLKKESAVVNNGLANISPGGWIRAGNDVRLSGNMEVNIVMGAGVCTFVIRNSSGVDIFSRNIISGSENFMIDNIASGNYDIYILNNNETRSTFVDSLLIANVQ